MVEAYLKSWNNSSIILIGSTLRKFFLKSVGLFHLRIQIIQTCRRHYKPLHIEREYQLPCKVFHKNFMFSCAHINIDDSESFNNAWGNLLIKKGFAIRISQHSKTHANPTPRRLTLSFSFVSETCLCMREPLKMDQHAQFISTHSGIIRRSLIMHNLLLLQHRHITVSHIFNLPLDRINSILLQHVADCV